MTPPPPPYRGHESEQTLIRLSDDASWLLICYDIVLGAITVLYRMTRKITHIMRQFPRLMFSTTERVRAISDASVEISPKKPLYFVVCSSLAFFGENRRRNPSQGACNLACYTLTTTSARGNERMYQARLSTVTPTCPEVVVISVPTTCLTRWSDTRTLSALSAPYIERAFLRHFVP